MGNPRRLGNPEPPAALPYNRRLATTLLRAWTRQTIEKLGSAPLKPHLDRIARMTSKQDLPKVLAELHMVTADDGLFFGFDSDQDFSDATKVIAFASAGGIGLPDRDYYLKDDDKSKEIRAQYLAHVAKSFELIGDTREAAARNADTVMSYRNGAGESARSRALTGGTPITCFTS